MSGQQDETQTSLRGRPVTVTQPQSACSGLGQRVRRLLGCDTDDQCRSIQRGRVWVKRLGKWAMLFSIGLTLFVSDLIATMVDTLQQYEAPTTTFLYRWTIGWFADVPRGGASLIAVWKFVDLIQFLFFAGVVLVTIRWTYADCRVSNGRVVTFRRLAVASVATNIVVYFGLRLLATAGGIPI